VTLFEVLSVELYAQDAATGAFLDDLIAHAFSSEIDNGLTTEVARRHGIPGYRT
jgi:hypothetical protein